MWAPKCEQNRIGKVFARSIPMKFAFYRLASYSLCSNSTGSLNLKYCFSPCISAAQPFKIVFCCSMFPVSLNKLISRIFYSGFHSGLLGNRFVINWNIWYLCLYLEYFQFLELHCENIFLWDVFNVFML